MNTIPSVSTAVLNPAELIEKADQRFKQFDNDDSGTLSKSELVEFRSSRGLDTSRVDKVFAWLDMDSDGVISKQEHEDRVLAMAQRRAAHTGAMEYSKPDADARREAPDVSMVIGALTNLVESIDSSSAGERPQQETVIDQLRELTQKFEMDGFTEQNMSSLADLLTIMVPPIDESA